MVQGLKAKPELNNKIGTVKYFIIESGRYAVEFIKVLYPSMPAYQKWAQYSTNIFFLQGEGTVALRTANLHLPDRQELNALRIAQETAQDAEEQAKRIERAAVARAARQKKRDEEHERKRQERVKVLEKVAFQEEKEDIQEESKEKSLEVTLVSFRKCVRFCNS